jgi:hypothetical protein
MVILLKGMINKSFSPIIRDNGGIITYHAYGGDIITY